MSSEYISPNTELGRIRTLYGNIYSRIRVGLGKIDDLLLNAPSSLIQGFRYFNDGERNHATPITIFRRHG